MPHVIQLSKTPIPPQERLNADQFDYEDDPLRSIADYVSTDEAPQETITLFLQDLKENNASIVEEGDGPGHAFSFHAGFREAYFKPGYASFLAHARKLADATTLDDFIKGYPDGDIFGLREAFHERYGWYVYFDTMTITLDDFMRHYAQEDVRYFIGETVYYHT